MDGRPRPGCGVDAEAGTRGLMAPEPLRVTEPDALGDLLDLIHDEFFDLDSVAYSPADRHVTIPYRRVSHGGPKRTVRNWLLLRTEQVHVVRSVLAVRNVLDCACQDRARIGTYSLNTVDYDGSTLMFRCEPDLDLTMEVTGLDIESRDVEVRGKARINYWLSVCESYSGKVIE